MKNIGMPSLGMPRPFAHLIASLEKGAGGSGEILFDGQDERFAGMYVASGLVRPGGCARPVALSRTIFYFSFKLEAGWQLRPAR